MTLKIVGSVVFSILFSTASIAAPIPSPSPSPCVCTCPGPQDGKPTLSPKDITSLLTEFKKAQALELKALDHRHKFQIRDLVATQKSRRKDWEKKEQEARRAYFKEHIKGPERREYVADFIKRRKLLLEMFANEKNERQQAQMIRRKALADEQSSKLKEFQDALKSGTRPPEDLWPAPGG